MQAGGDSVITAWKPQEFRDNGVDFIEKDIPHNIAL